MKTSFMRVVAFLMVFQLLGTSVPQIATATLVGTRQVLDGEERGGRLEGGCDLHRPAWSDEARSARRGL